jgi:5-methyltetrahydropteroyltriglutamate--homocysteine methyltransferase
VHICFGYAAIIHQRPSGYSFLSELAGYACTQVSIETAQAKLDCLDLHDPAVEAPETIVARIKRALPYVKLADIILAPDCGMKYLPRDVAFGKISAMVAAAKRLRAEVGGR